MSKLVEVKIEKCPFCNGTEFIDGGLYGNGGINLNKRSRRVPLHVVVCRDCGSVVRMFTEKPDKLLPLFKRKRKNKNAKNKEAKGKKQPKVEEVNPVEEVVVPVEAEVVQPVEEVVQQDTSANPEE